MKRIQFHRYGGPEEMHLEEYRLPNLADDEILVRVKAASINPIDWKIRQGAMRLITGRKFPRGMGQDFSGTVEDIGRSVKRFKMGDEVFGTTSVKTSGAFAEMLITKEALAVAKPVALSHQDAATLPVAASTAWIVLVQKAELKAGQKVFINGAYGAVGQAATQIAKSLGAYIVGRVGGDCLDAAKNIGVDIALDYRQGLPPELFGQFDVVFDTHGSLAVNEGGQLIKRGGVIFDINPSPAKLLRIVLSPSRRFVMGNTDQVTMEKVINLANSGKLKISIDREVQLYEAIDLIQDLESGGRVKGKGVVVIEGHP